jgi:hypothetical protein
MNELFLLQPAQVVLLKSFGFSVEDKEDNTYQVSKEDAKVETHSQCGKTINIVRDEKNGTHMSIIWAPSKDVPPHPKTIAIGGL